MTLTEKIDEACHLFSLCGGNYSKTLRYLKIGQPTLKNYVSIGNHLEFSLLENLDKKGSEKISMSLALKLVNSLFNPDHQLKVYASIKHLSNKERILKIDEHTECPICFDNSPSHEYFKCCDTFVCTDCVYKHLDISINDIVFEGCKCPMCSKYMSKKKITGILDFGSKSYPEKQWIIRNKEVSYRSIYYKNLLMKFIEMIEAVRKINKKTKRTINPNLRIFQKSFQNSEIYYGNCKGCCPRVSKRKEKPLYQYNLKVKTIDKECVNGNGELVVLHKDMFKCEKCITKEEQENIFKKCPHCGIKTLKPDGCNYVNCGDHRWCFICNERLPDNHEGHNVHYWMGPGTSPWGDSCRRSSNYQINNRMVPDFVLNMCDCSSCSQFGGAPLCRSLDCMERGDKTSDGFKTLCSECL